MYAYESEWWNERAICADDECEPEIFFDTNLVAEAKSWCEICPVKKECLAFAIKLQIPHGVFGGLTEKEREKLLKQPAANTRLPKG